jgi:hypothetical protein
MPAFSPYVSRQYCVSIAFAGALPDSHANRRLLVSLKSLSDAASKRRGCVSLAGFRKVLLHTQMGLGLSLAYCEIRQEPLRDALRRTTGQLIISNGKGHAIGISCADRTITDAAPRGALRRISLDKPGAEHKMAKAFGLQQDEWVNVLVVALQ